MTNKIEFLGQNVPHFDRFEGPFLTFLGVTKVVFWTFSKLFRCCVRKFLALFLLSKDLLFAQILTLFATYSSDSLLWGPANVLQGYLAKSPRGVGFLFRLALNYTPYQEKTPPRETFYFRHFDLNVVVMGLCWCCGFEE